MLSVNEELERLVKVGELARVDYKGSASFRIVNKDQTNGQGTKQKRKKKSALANTSENISSGGQLAYGLTSTLPGIVKYIKIFRPNIWRKP